MKERGWGREKTAVFFRTEQTVVYFPLFVCLLSVNRGHSISLLLLLFYLILSIYHPIESPVPDKNKKKNKKKNEKNKKNKNHNNKKPACIVCTTVSRFPFSVTRYPLPVS